MEDFVPRNHILKELGGNENWSYQYVEPVTGENDIMKDTATRDKLLAERAKIVKEFEGATLAWIERSTDADATAIKEKRHKLAFTLRDDYWKVDPYLRAKTLYDRLGMIQPGGKIIFYPEAVAATTGPAINGVHKAETSIEDID